MATRIIVPHLGESITSATLVTWFKAVGDQVERGEELGLIETDKATMPLEAPRDGEVLAILVDEGTEVGIGELLGAIGKPGEAWSRVKTSPPPRAQEQKDEMEERPGPGDQRPQEPARRARRRRVSPLARRRAKELGVDIDAVSTASGSRVKVDDVERFAEQADAALSHQVELSGLRRIVGERMLASTREIPQFSVSVKVDASALLTARGELSVTALLAHFTARALRAHPRLNSQYDGGALTAFETVNLCVAVATPEGLRVPVVRRAEELTVAELDDRIRELAEKARRNRLTGDDVADGTFTISNLGMYGVTQFTPIINPPQAAILGIGKPLGLFTPDGRGGMQQVELMDLTVSADHRAVDGADVAEFLSTLKDLVETCEIA